MAHDDLKSLTPKEVLSKRGASILVINPGSETLTIGRGSDLRPIRVPHLIAYLQKPGTKDQSASPPTNLALRSTEREAASREASAFLRLGSGDHIWRTPQQEPDTPRVKACPPPVWISPTGENRRFIYGEDVQLLGDAEPYRVVRPFVSGRLNPERSPVQLLSDLANVWKWAVECRLGIPDADFGTFSVVLVVSEHLDSFGVEILVDTVLRELGFKEVVVHIEATAATFGQGCSGACVVNIGAQTTSVSCVEDGIVIAGSKLLLPYGGSDVAETLEWLLRMHGIWSHEGFNPRTRPCDFKEINRVAVEGCFIPAEGQEPFRQGKGLNQPKHVISVRTGGGEMHGYTVTLGPSACIAPMGILYPSLFGSQQNASAPGMRESQCTVETCSRETSMSEYAKQSTLSRDYFTPTTPASSMGEYEVQDQATGLDTQESALHAGLQRVKDRNCPLPLDTAILETILGLDRPDLRRRLFSSILLVGGGSGLAGLADVLERRILAALPQDEQTDTVAVLEGKGDGRDTVWKGGVLLGVLDNGDHWVRSEEWINGLRVGDPSKFGKSDISSSKVFWFFRAQQGV